MQMLKDKFVEQKVVSSPEWICREIKIHTIGIVVDDKENKANNVLGIAL